MPKAEDTEFTRIARPMTGGQTGDFLGWVVEKKSNHRPSIQPTGLYGNLSPISIILE